MGLKTLKYWSQERSRNIHYVQIPFDDKKEEIDERSKKISESDAGTSVVYGLKTASTYYEHVTYGFDAKKERQALQKSLGKSTSSSVTTTTTTSKSSTSTTRNINQSSNFEFEKPETSRRGQQFSNIGGATSRVINVTNIPVKVEPSFRFTDIEDLEQIERSASEKVTQKLPIFVEEEILEENCVQNDSVMEEVFPGFELAIIKTHYSDELDSSVLSERPTVLNGPEVYPEVESELQRGPEDQDRSEDELYWRIRDKVKKKKRKGKKPELEGDQQRDEENLDRVEEAQNIFLTECPDSDESNAAETKLTEQIKTINLETGMRKLEDYTPGTEPSMTQLEILLTGTIASPTLLQYDSKFDHQIEIQKSISESVQKTMSFTQNTETTASSMLSLLASGESVTGGGPEMVGGDSGVGPGFCSAENIKVRYLMPRSSSLSRFALFDSHFY